MAGKRSKISDAEFEKFKANLKKPPVKTEWDSRSQKPALRRSMRTRNYTDYESNTNDFWNKFSPLQLSFWNKFSPLQLRLLLERDDELYDGKDSSKKAEAGGDEEDEESAHESEDADEDASDEGDEGDSVGGTPAGSGGAGASGSAPADGPSLLGGPGGARTAGDLSAGASGTPSGGSLRNGSDSEVQNARLARYRASLARSKQYSPPSKIDIEQYRRPGISDSSDDSQTETFPSKPSKSNAQSVRPSHNTPATTNSAVGSDDDRTIPHTTLPPATPPPRSNSPYFQVFQPSTPAPSAAVLEDTSIVQPLSISLKDWVPILHEQSQ
ncbi:hypothetical protein KC345_g8006 [Hortaea werneckii]|nr:hypothetical protein KC345_g8006 [Hortaea werneckii]